ncbi:threonine/serine ThrE exporter family protein [Microbacterium binotii]|uniref:threonine/serine ThrE exporter family protein n=1 Tax=Microbacterium binotii TaxID=462710 RepID=UPI001F375CF4|nr:threonine/serine exporter family protein [Microbacterium binotii]UIN30795.1 threonine/serine exporter family protein [Microbacterium binotii]
MAGARMIPADDGDATPLDEARLEPVRFVALTDAVLRLGILMLGAGASSARVRTTMERVGRAWGIEAMNARVGMLDIVLTVSRGQLVRTRVAEVARPVVNAERIAALQRLSHEVEAEAGGSVEDFAARLDAIAARPARYGMLLRVIAAGAACAAFALLNNGGWAAAVAVGLGAAAGQAIRMLLGRARLNEFLTVFLAAATALLIYLGAAQLLEMLGQPFAHDAALTSAVLFLVPGFPLVTGAMDLARLDLNAGIARVVYACLILLTAGSAVWAVAALFATSPVAVATPLLGEPVLAVLRLVAGFVGVLGFALLFATPWRIAIASAAVGAIANTARLTAVDAGLMPAVAAMAAGVLVGLGAFVCYRRLDAPRVALTVPAVVIMVPGAAAYRAIVATIDGDTLAAVQNSVQALFVVAALAIGLTVARVVSEKEWGDRSR